ncbi:glutamic acid-rich protein-like [Pieris napi]|uniref:glutamic acid-rich protein-like n=1 Tax=Pieris napi TaxID=78633 RepID=UPI001FB94BC3|nr:glutamic acid-rich protein-like [Pieris napi]
MSLIKFILLVLIPSCYTLSIGVSDKNVTKRTANHDLFPDWVPFKNKHGVDLGDFEPVVKKPKKRLATPLNFVLKAVAEPDGDYYFDKSQGESDNEDYFERKEWSDLHRPAEHVDPNYVVTHNASDIDGIVNIITKPIDDPVLKHILKKNKERKAEKEKEKEKDDAYQDENKDEENLETKTENEKIMPSDEEAKTEKRPRRYEDDVEYDEGSDEKQKPERVERTQNTELSEEEKRENEEKKARILSSVDELKHRHAKEQREISEKLKEEELFKEDFERDKLDSSEEHDKYNRGSRWKKPEYDEYDDGEVSLHDKYKINTMKSITRTTQAPKKSRQRKSKKEKSIINGKLSVFRNPQLYMINDEEDTTTSNPKPTQPEKYSSKYSADDDSIRISLVPSDDDSKDGEPTRFYPKKRKNKRKKTTTPTEGTTEVGTVKTTELDTTASDTDLSASNTAPSAADTVPTAFDTAPSAIGTSASDNTASDATAADTNEETHAAIKKEKKHGNFKHEKGGGREHESESFEEHEEEGKKAYEGHHDDTKTSKGHHDKEDHLKKYKDEGGVDKSHHDEKEHYGDHHHEEHGKKHAKYEESGKHSKGHSTKGSHDIHKKDEYEKRVEFFEEDGDSAEEENYGGHHNENEHSAGGNFKKTNLDAAHKGRSKGETGHFLKNGRHELHRGHRGSGGHNHHAHAEKQRHSDGEVNGGKKWVYHHGHPAKTAQLVVIDRRGDYQHGPQYYG